jgi:hypothetical protein
LDYAQAAEEKGREDDGPLVGSDAIHLPQAAA